MKFLIDENLSPRLVQRLAGRGYLARHVAHLGMAGASDPAVWTYAFANDQVVVTINAADFLHLAASVEVHPGLIVLRSQGLSRDEQWAWLEPVLNWLEASGESPVNKAVEVTASGKFRVRDLPPP